HHQILIDCGNTTFCRLRELGLAKQVQHILITHCHDDHVGSLATLLLYLKHVARQQIVPTIWVPSTDFQLHIFQYLQFAMPKPEKYARFQLLHEQNDLIIEGIDTFGLHVPGMQSYGYCFEDEEEVVLYSGDIGPSDILFDHLETKSEKPIRVFHDVTFEAADGIHAYYLDLLPYLKTYQIFGYHHDHRQVPDDNPIALVAEHPELLLVPQPS
ncbi:MAG: MBL fold metallo-hydrolase, partial [Bacteroidota bacterium]